jgi:hypothetical protein
MIEELKDLFMSISSAVKGVEVFQKLMQGKRGDSLLLIEELKENMGLCWMVAARETDPFKIIPELITQEYDRLLRQGFDFNVLYRKPIEQEVKLSQTELSHFIGQETAFLIENIYDKIKELKRIFRVDQNNPKIRWRARILNIHKRLLLLVWHLTY